MCTPRIEVLACAIVSVTVYCLFLIATGQIGLKTSTMTYSRLVSQLHPTAIRETLKNVFTFESKEPRTPQFTFMDPRLNHSSGTALPRVAMLTYYSQKAAEKQYSKPLTTLECYAKRENIRFMYINDDNQTIEQQAICNHTFLLFRKHCLVSLTLDANPDIEWFYVLDADSGVANPNHSLYEYLDAAVDLIFYERFYIWEIAAGNYIVRNTEFARQFLHKWANLESELPTGKIFHSYDNGANHILLLKTVYDDRPEVAEECAKHWYGGLFYQPRKECALAFKNNPNRRAIVEDRVSPAVFMEHGWKEKQLKQGTNWVLQRLPRDAECDPKLKAAWPIRPGRLIADDAMRQILAHQEVKQQERFKLHLQPDVGECFPFCEVNDTSKFQSPAKFRLSGIRTGYDRLPFVC